MYPLKNSPELPADLKFKLLSTAISKIHLSNFCLHINGHNLNELLLTASKKVWWAACIIYTVNELLLTASKKVWWAACIIYTVNELLLTASKKVWWAACIIYTDDYNREYSR